MKTLLKYYFLGFFYLGITDLVQAQTCVTATLTLTAAECGNPSGEQITNQGGSANGTAPNATCNWGIGSAGTSSWISFTYVGPPTQQFLLAGQGAGGSPVSQSIAVYSANGCTQLGCSSTNPVINAGESASDASIDLTTLGLTVGNTYLARIYSDGSGAARSQFLECVPAQPCGDCFTSPCVITNINTSFTSSTWGSIPMDCCTWTSGMTGIANLNCPGPGGISVDGSIYYQVTACAAGTITAVLDQFLCNDAAGSQMWFLDGCGDAASILGGQCSNTGTMADATLSLAVTAGQTFYILVDSYAGNTCTFGMTLTGPVCLPVKLSSFKAQEVDEEKVFLKWETSSEQNNYQFTLQRSVDGLSFSDIVSIRGAGNSSTSNTYSYLDNTSGLGSPIYYYRLLQQDYDGRREMSAAAVVNMKGQTEGLKIISLQNVGNQLNIEYYIEKNAEEKLNFNIYSTLGNRVIEMENLDTKEGTHTVSLNTNGVSGLYIYSFEFKGKAYTGKLFLKD